MTTDVRAGRLYRIDGRRGWFKAVIPIGDDGWRMLEVTDVGRQRGGYHAVRVARIGKVKR